MSVKPGNAFSLFPGLGRALNAGVIGVSIRRLVKRFGSTVALAGVSLEVEPGELFFLLGPSGCGKTTLLRALAGFCQPEEGEIYFGSREVSRLPAHERETGMVFQNYALWPHKSVAQNVAFGLEERRTPKAETARRVEEALAAVRMEGYGARGIHQLSGGQQQRVALARALVIRPRCLLLDEPLSNLDARLRLEMRTEIRRICKEAGLTAIYVTHDQKEALSVADRIAVMRDGEVCQVGTPEEVYRRPVNRFVADFIGETNFFEARVVVCGEERVEWVTSGGERFVTGRPAGTWKEGNRATLSVRPEAWRMMALAGDADAEGNTVAGEVRERSYQGEVAQYQVATALGIFKVLELNPGLIREGAAPGDACRLSVAAGEIMVFAE